MWASCVILASYLMAKCLTSGRNFCSVLWGSLYVFVNIGCTPQLGTRREQVVPPPAWQRFHPQLCIQASTCCRSSTSSFHIRLWSAASSERSAIFTARMTGSGETAWMTPITMTYLPVTTGAGGQLFTDNGEKNGDSVFLRWRHSCEVIFQD